MKHSFLNFSALVCLVIFFSSCNNESAKTGAGVFSLDSAKAAIAASNNIFGASFTTGDSTAFVNCYASDGCIYNANMPKQCGAQAINGFFNVGYQFGIRKIALTTEEVMGGKEAVVETGKYEVFIANNVSVEKGKFVVIWKEENGKWKMFRDIWNSDAPAPPPAVPVTK